jgi:group I intron endonuclease
MIFISERRKDMKQSGIYKITINDKVYVGLSRKLKRRYNYHSRKLKDKLHCNKHLQAAYNIHGTFTFEIIEYCEPEVLEEREVFWMDELKVRDRRFGYNMIRGGDAPIGMRGKDNGMYGVRLVGSQNGMYGRKHSPETLEKIAKAVGDVHRGRKQSTSHKKARGIAVATFYKEKALTEGRTLYRCGRWVKPKCQEKK